MLDAGEARDDAPPSLSFHLLGETAWDRCFALQRQLLHYAETDLRVRLVVLMCEHPPIVTVGRGGSRGDVRMHCQQLRRRGVRLQWTGRGGGCIPHSPGQLSIYPIVPLARLGWTVGELARRLQRGAAAALGDLGLRTTATTPPHLGLAGRSGLLAAFGLAVRNWISWHGLHVNVNPPLDVFRLVDTLPASGGRAPASMSSLVSEAGPGVRMKSTAVRAALVAQLAQALEVADYTLHTGHPLLSTRKPPGLPACR